MGTMMGIRRGGGSGCTLTVTGVAGDTATLTKGSKTYTKTLDSSGKAVFKGLSGGTWTAGMSNGTESTSRNVNIVADYAVTLAYFSATIAVTWPAGSTCTCANGSTVLTAPDTSGSYTFTVTNTGTWTVSCTNGTENASTTVSITADGQSASVTLTYFDGTIYDAGTVSPYVELNMISNPSGRYTDEYGQNSLAFKTTSGKGAGFLCAKVDVSGYSVLKVSYESLNTQYGIGFAAINQTATADYDIYPEGYAQFTSMGAGAKETALDISTFSGEYYVGIWDRKWDNSSKSLTVYKIWME